MIDRRQVIEDTGDLSVSRGANRVTDDTTLDQREDAQQLRQSTYQLHFGSVQYAISGLGWSRVALGSGNGIVSAGAGGRSDVWGVQVDHAYEPGSQVLVAVDELTHEAVILGNLPRTRIDAGDQFAFPSFVGSWADIGRDAAAETYVSAVDAGGAKAIHNGAMSDVHQGDWAVRSSTGVFVMLTTLEAVVAVDDVTGLWVNLIDQSAELSGRQVGVLADGVRLQSRLSSEVTRLQLGGKLEFHDDPEMTLSEDITALSRTDSDYVYQFETEPVELFQLNTYAMAIGSVKHDRGDRLTTGEDYAVNFAESAEFPMSELRFLEHRPGAEDISSLWHPQPPEDAEADEETRKELVSRLEEWKWPTDSLHFSRPLFAFASVASQWVKSPEQYVYLRQAPTQLDFIEEGETSSLVDDYRENEAIQFGDGEGIDGVFAGKLITNEQRLSGWVIRERGGSLFLGNEHGAGIIIAGTGVTITGGSVRLAAHKDVTILGRDVNLSGNRDVNITARTFLRAYSDKNVGIAGGLSQQGGVLIESRGSSQSASLPENAQDAVLSGVSIKAKSQVALFGGDVIANAGTAKNLILKASGGSAVISTSGYMTIHSSGRLDTFGSSEDRPSASHFYGQNQVVFAGTLSATDAFFAGSVNADSNIQTFRGSFGSQAGGTPGKVQSTGLFDEALQSLRRTNSDARQQVSERLSESYKTLKESGGPLNNKYQTDLSSGFVSTSKAARHFGAATIQPPYFAVFGQDWSLPSKSREPFRVTYKPDSSTIQTEAWPGNASEISVQLPAGVTPLRQRMRNALTGQPPEPQTREVRFSELFQTLGDSDE